MSETQLDPHGTRKDPKRSSDGAEASVVPIREPDPLEGTIPPTPLRDLLAADGASVYVLSDDASLLATAREAGGEQYPVFPAGSWQALRDAVAEQRCGIALLDVDSVPGTLGERLAELSGLRPALVILLASNRESADGLLTLLSERKIHRLLIKPPTVGITRLMLESSVSRHIELRQQPVAEPVASTAAKGGLARWPSWMLAGGLVIGVLATVALTSLSNRQDTPAGVVTTPVAEEAVSALPPQDIDAPTAEVADAPLADLAPVEAPVETSEPLANVDPVAAIAPEPLPATPADLADSEQPSAVTAESLPDDAAAAVTVATEQAVAVPLADSLEAPQLDLDAMYAGVEAALIAEDLDTAAALLTELQAFAPGASRLGFLSAQIGRERARIASIEEAAVAEAAAPSELTSLIGLARARLEQAQLVAPQGDSALDYFRRAALVDAEAAEVEALAADLGAAVLTAAEIALAEGRFAEAEVLFMEAQALSVADEDLVALELSLVYARESLARAAQDELLSEAGARLSQGQLFEPATASALSALLEVQRQNPDHPGLEAAFAELEEALQAAAEATLADGDWNRAESVIEALSQSGAPLSALEPLRAELRFGRTQEAFLAEAAPASELAVLEFEPALYPQRARRQGIEGWVDLEFVVDSEGQPYDITVTGAEPAGEFDAAAVAAAASYVYVPFELDGRVYERRVGLRMRFALE